jgi:type II secretion system protein J
MKCPALRARQSRAFTMVEILVAFVIFSMVILAIYSTYTLILKSAQIGQAAAAQIQRERVAVNTLKEALAGVVSYQSAPEYYSFFADNENNGFLSFSARLPELFPRSGMPRFHGYDLRRVEFSIEDGPESQRQLVLRQMPLLREMERDEQDFPYVVARGVNKMEFEFWDQQKSDWVSEWTRTNELPKMLKFKLELIRSNPRNPSAIPVKVEVIDIAALPAIMVPTIYQAPNQPGAPGAPPGTPPGGIPNPAPPPITP